jgi:MscS family membrane protein
VRLRRALHLASFVLLAASVPASAQIFGKPVIGPAAPTPTPAAAPEVAPDSPRSAVAEFIGLTRAGKYAEAARFLDLPAQLAGRGPELARKLKLVLDQDLWIDLEKVSPLPPGHREDGLPPELEEIGTITGANGKPEPVRLVRKDRTESPIWVFSRTTVARVPEWYAALENREILDHVPLPLLRPGPRQLLWWQWLAAVALFVPAWWGGKLLGWVSRKGLLRIARRTPTPWDEALLLRMRGPFTLGWMLVILRAGLPFLGLYLPAEAFALQVLKAGAIGTFFWAVLRTITVSGEVLAGAPWAVANAGARSALEFSVRFGRLFVIGMGVLAALAALGLPVNNVLAGVGIGGIAIAFAAQKTVENFFGAISIGVDQPLRVGDFVRVSGVEGTVENIGLRSTRIRTLDRTLVTIPNGKLADMQIESFAERDRIRLAATLTLQYGTTSAQLREVISGIEALLRAHPKIWPDTVVVRFLAFADSSLNVELMAWFQTTDVAEFREIRQEVLLGIMEVVERTGASFAFPTRTVHLVGPSGAAAGA